MNKPLSVMKDEFENEIVNLVNQSGLPLFIVEYVLSNILANVKVAAKKQFDIDLKTYKESIIMEAKSNVPVENEIWEKIKKD